MHRVDSPSTTTPTKISNRDLSALADQIADRLKTIEMPSRRAIFSEIAESYMSERKHLKASTIATYRHVLQAHLLPKFGQAVWDTIDSHTIAIYRSELASALSGRTVNKIIGLLRALTTWATGRGLCLDDSRKTVAMSSVREESTKIDPFGMDELDKVLRCISPRFRQLFACAAWTGARPSELTALRWRDIDWKANEIDINKARVRGKEGTTKTRGSTRRIPMFPPTRIALELQKQFSYSDENQYVFVNTRQSPFVKGLDGIWKRACIRAGIRHRPAYQLRHTFASLCLEAGESPAYVAHLLGHSTPEITFRCYARWIPNQRRDGQQLQQAIREHYGDKTPIFVDTPHVYRAPARSTAPVADSFVDPLDRFLMEQTVKERTATIDAHDLHNNYACWTVTDGRIPLNRTAFGKCMSARGFYAQKISRGRFKYLGITMRTAPELAQKRLPAS